MASAPPLPLRAYRLFARVAAPLAPRLLARRLNRGREHPARLNERYGETRLPRPAGPLVWLHGASVGELSASIPLIERLCQQQFQVLCTSVTVTSAKFAQERLPKGARHQFAPIDVPAFVARFLDHWRPDLALFVESDLWPNLVMASKARGIPLVIVNGRLSARTFRRWHRFPRSIAALLRCFDLCLAQSERDAGRLRDLGAPRVAVTGNLKVDVPASPAEVYDLRALDAAIGDRPVIAATSTHPGEETVMIQAHRRLRQKFPQLLTMIAPRHPDRGQGIVEIASHDGLRAVQRSRGALPAPTTDIYVFDTLGELGLVYRLASIAFIGGSLVQHGGQNPVEAIKLGAAILHGPHVRNFADLYVALDAAHGAESVTEAEALAERFGAWLGDRDARNASVEAARRTMERFGGALERTLEALNPYLMQLRLEPRADHA